METKVRDLVPGRDPQCIARLRAERQRRVPLPRRRILGRHERAHGHEIRRLGPLARETRITDGGVGEDLTLLGACALLLTRELGLTVHR